jgi:hypothetical protein
LASVKYSKGAENQPDLVGVSSGIGIPVEDVFVIPIPEIKFVGFTDSTFNAPIAYPFEDYAGLVSNVQDLGFRIELRLPRNVPSAPTGSIMSLDACVNPSDRENTLGSQSMDGLTFSQQPGGIRYATYLSNRAFIPSRTIVAPGEDQPEVPDGFSAMFLPNAGAFQAAFQIGAFVERSPVQEAGQLKRPGQILEKGAENVGDENQPSFEFRIPSVADPALDHYVFKFTNELTQHDTTKERRGPWVYTRFVEGPDATAKSGGEDDPIHIQLKTDPANRRATFLLVVTAVDKNGQTIKGAKPIQGRVFVAFPRYGVGGELPQAIFNNPAAELDAGTLYRTPANFNFDPKTIVIQGDNEKTAQARLQVEDRIKKALKVDSLTGPLTFTGANLEGVYATTIVTAYAALSNNAAGIDRVYVVGTGLFDAAKQTDKDDLESIIAHENDHVRAGFAFKLAVEGAGAVPLGDLTDDEKAFGTLLRDAFLDIYEEVFALPADEQTQQNKLKYQTAANNFIVRLDEIRALVNEINAAGAASSKTSWRRSLDAVRALSFYWFEALADLKRGIPVANREDNIPVDKVRARVFEFLQQQYKKFNDPFGPGVSGAFAAIPGTKGGTLAIKSGRIPVVAEPKEVIFTPEDK